MTPDDLVTAVRLATAVDLSDLVRLESALFVEDAGRHDPEVDVGWPGRDGAADFTRLLGDVSSVVLVAERAGSIVGHAVGHLARPSATRHDRVGAELRSLYVEPAARRAGVAAALVDAFAAWAGAHGATRLTVSSYVANDAARSFYRRRGFGEVSVTSALSI